ncbi:hypothetical protein [Desulforapulum autotrophicum]|nr:hypothetical protein [Desulforapulum autotrophicum]
MVKQVRVHTDQKGKPLVLKMSGNVEKIVMVDPNVVHFVGSPEDTLETTVNIVPLKKYDFSLKDQPLAGMKNVAAVLKSSGSGKKSWQLVVTNTRKTVGRYYEVITLKTDSLFQPELKIRVFGNLTAKGSLQSTAP